MFKKSYVVSAETWDEMLKKKKKKTNTTPPLAVHLQKSTTFEPLARGLTATSRLNRYKKQRAMKKLKPLPSAGRIDSYFLPEATQAILSQLPLDVRQPAMTLLNFVSKKIPPSLFTWDQKTLELIFRRDVLPESNFVDVVKYLFGVGDAWVTSYKHVQLGEYVGRIQPIPRGASHFYFILEQHQETPTTVFGFHPPFVLNLARFHYYGLDTQKTKTEQTQAVQTFADRLQDETTQIDLLKFYEHDLWAHPKDTVAGLIPARYPLNLDIVPANKTPLAPSGAPFPSEDRDPTLRNKSETMKTKKLKKKSERDAAAASNTLKRVAGQTPKFHFGISPAVTFNTWNDEMGGGVLPQKRARNAPDRWGFD